MRLDRHGQELVRYIAELERGLAYGPSRVVRLVRLIAATLDPAKLAPESTWFLVLGSWRPRSRSPRPPPSRSEQVDERYRLRDWIEHDDKPATHELGWADY